MAIDLRVTRARDGTLPPPVPIIELPRRPRVRVRWARVAGLAVALIGSAGLWALIVGAVLLLLR